MFTRNESEKNKFNIKRILSLMLRNSQKSDICRPVNIIFRLIFRTIREKFETLESLI